MTIEDQVFKKYSVDFKKLIKYGFQEKKNCFLYEKLFKNNEFRANITVLKTGEVQGKVFEVESGDEYLPLRVEDIQGAFVGEVREEYTKILTDIRNNCCSQNYFIFPQTNRIADAIIARYGDKPDFMWDKFPNFGVFKNSANNKWYGAIMNIDYSKLRKDAKNPIEIINIKLDKDKIQHLLKRDGFYPAWHMNKTSWITITLDETTPDSEIMDLVDESYSYTVEPQKEWIIPANPKYFDIIKAFENNNEILWKQTSKIKKGDIAYMYVANPISAILFKCEVTDINIPYDYEDKNLKIDKVMKIKMLKKYKKDFMTFEKLNQYGITSIRGQRTCPDELIKSLNY